MLTPSWHAKQRIWERNLSDEAIAAALAGRVVEGVWETYHYDRATRVCVVSSGDRIVTAFKMRKAQVKRLLSR